MKNKEMEFIELRAQGRSFREISELLDVSKPTLISYKEHRDQIANAVAIESEARIKLLKIDHESRQMRVAMVVDKLEQRITNLDFSELPPADALRLLAKYLELMKAENEPVTFRDKPDFWGLEERKIKWKA